MTNSIKSIINFPRDLIVEIECHLSNNLPSIHIIGFASKATDEAKDRLRASFSSSELELPKKHITINLSPADVPKEGTVFDLAIAAAILLRSNQVDFQHLRDAVLLGELNLSGELSGIRGIIGYLMSAKTLGVSRFYLPEQNLRQAMLVPEITVYPVKNLRQLYLHLSGAVPITARHSNNGQDALPGNRASSDSWVDFTDITGQNLAKRALEIAAAGRHNILLNGPPGVGKSMLAKALVGILPGLDHQQALEVTQLHSLTSSDPEQIYTTAPLRSPHHNTSVSSLVGGGSRPLPGEITLAHNGVLFLDELPEFSRSALEALRQPIEDGVITVSRVRESIRFPARFMLVATKNPCPCGYLGSSRECVCSSSAIYRYQNKISGPIIDRIDIQVNAESVELTNLMDRHQKGETTDVIAKRVLAAHQLQQLRLGNSRTNNSMTNKEVREFALLSLPSKKLLDEASEKLHLSARSYMRSIKVARTIADLSDSRFIEVGHIAEALQFRLQPATSLLTPVI